MEDLRNKFEKVAEMAQDNKTNNAVLEGKINIMLTLNVLEFVGLIIVVLTFLLK